MKDLNQPINCHATGLDMRCTNQGCEYEGVITIFNGQRPMDKLPCPECGFKCLAPNDAFSEQALQRMVDAISKEDREKIDKAVEIFNESIKKDTQPCLLKSFMDENPDHTGPLYLSCPCKRCTPYSM